MICITISLMGSPYWPPNDQGFMRREIAHVRVEETGRDRRIVRS